MKLEWSKTLEDLGNLKITEGSKWKSSHWVAQSCPTLCNHMDCSLPGSFIHGIFQARVLGWVAISFSRGSFQSEDWTQVSRIAGRHFTIWAANASQRARLFRELAVLCILLSYWRWYIWWLSLIFCEVRVILWSKHTAFTPDVIVKVSVPQSCPTLCESMDFHHGLQSRFLWPQNSPGKNTGVGCHFLLQGIFLTQGLNPGLLHLQTDSLLSEPPGKPLTPDAKEQILISDEESLVTSNPQKSWGPKDWRLFT